jgi:PQQ-dependent dehydrogenase (methanol/ethanol family)
MVGVAAAGLALAGFAPGDSVVNDHRLAAADGETGSWLTVGRTYAEQRYSPLNQIDTQNVAKLGLAWHHEFDTDRGQEATPLMVDGVLYTTTAWSKVYAFDARSGELLWSFDPHVDKRRGFSACCDVANRGVAIWDGKVYVGALDGRLIALNAKTGQVVWSKVTVDQSKPYTITGAPRVVKGRVLIGNGGSEYGVRGYLSAYDGKTGELAWRFYTTPNAEGKADGAASDDVLAGKAAPTWGGKVPATGGGGTVWDAITYDPEQNLVFFGAGNGSPWSAAHRSDGKSDNLFLSSIVAVNADTGKYVWHYQVTPDDTWDYDADQHLMQADLVIDGRPRKVIMQASKNGFFYVIDRSNGHLISAKNYVTTNWASSIDVRTGRPVENPEARYIDKPALVFPSPYGGHNWQPMAFDPKSGLVFIPAMDAPYQFANDPKFVDKGDGSWNTGLDMAIGALPTEKAQLNALKGLLKGELIAWDPVKQEARWTVQHPHFWNAGVMATAGGLVFQGDAEGHFNAYDAATGKEVWSYDVGNGVIAGASTYELDGQQYVAIMAGFGGAAPLAAHWSLPDRPRLAGRLLVFKIGGTDHAPAYPTPPVQTVDLTGVTSSGDPALGLTLYHQNCGVCHSPSASGHYLPNLQTSPLITSPAAFQSVVLGGALSADGMVSFSKYLTPEQTEHIRAYILKLAHDNQTAKGA